MSVYGPSQELVISRTPNTVWAVYSTKVLRDVASLATCRYEWAGNFSNIAPVNVAGRVPLLESEMFFGACLIAPSRILGLESKASEAMQDLLFDFVGDPGSLPSKGWPEHGTCAEGERRPARYNAGGQAF